MYMLRQKRASGIELRPGESLAEASRSLYDKLPTTTQPRTGDLVFYPAGYAMFYFADPRDGPFVLGMTPFGITALKSDFAKPSAIDKCSGDDHTFGLSTGIFGSCWS